MALGVLIWTGTTALATIAVWHAISGLGGPEAGAVLNAREVARALAANAVEQPSGLDPAVGSSPSPTAGPTGISATRAASPRPASGRPGTTGPSVADPGAPRSPSTPAPRATVRPTPARTASPAASAASVTEVWRERGGDLSVRCTGSRIELLYATPADGWTVRVEESGPEEVHVKFRSARDENELEARCVSGRPSLDSETDED